LREFAAVTTNPFGQGRVTYVGTVPDRTLAAALGEWIASTSLADDPWRSARATTMTCTASSTPDGSVLRFLHNWSWDGVDFAVPRAARDLLSGKTFDAGDQLRLDSWDVRILVEQEPD
jgi:beta-galactosidase